MNSSENPATRRADVVILGGGITGLALAAQLDLEGVSFVLLEKSWRFGGQIRTMQQSGYTYELGPNTGTISTPEVMDLFDYATGCRLQVANASAKSRWIWKKGKFRPLPNGLWSAITTPLFTWKDKIRILGEPWRKRGDNPLETVGELAERRLGKSFVNYAVDPFIGGIYAADPYKLVTRYALPKLQRLEDEHGSFIRGTIAKMRTPVSERDKRATKEVFSAEGGFEQLVSAIVERASQLHELRTHATCTELTRLDSGQWQVTFVDEGEVEHRVIARQVVSTVPAAAIADVAPKDLSERFRPLVASPYAPVVEVALGFDHLPQVPRNAFGGLVPSCEKRRILGVLFPSSCFAGRVPYADSALFTVFMGGTRNPQLLENSDQEIVDTALGELRDMLGIDPGITPDLVHVSRYPKAIPLYDETSPQRLALIRELEEKNPGFIIAGGMRDGIGLAHRIAQGMSLGRSIAAQLRD